MQFLAADVDFLAGQTITLYTLEFTKVASCRTMCVQDMKLAQLSNGSLADHMAREEGQNNVVRAKNEFYSSISV